MMPRLPPFGDDRPLGRLDQLLLAQSHVHQVTDPAVADELQDLLVGLRYLVRSLDASSWSSEHAMHESLAAAFDFPALVVDSLDCLDDWIRGVALFEHGSEAESGGTALFLRGFSSFATRYEQTAQSLLEIMASQERLGLLVDHPILCIVEAPEDCWFSPVGGTAVAHLRVIPRAEE